MRRRSLSANKAMSLILALVFSLSLFSCSDGRRQTDGTGLASTAGEASALSGTGAENGDNSGTVTFTDALGREVSVAKNPERTAALIGSFADVWQLAGGTLCASADDAWDDLGLDMGDAVNLGKTKEPNVEKLLSSEPDFVIASSATAADVEMKDVLEDAGITVAYFEVSSFADYLEMLDICTDITGRKDLYEKNGLQISEQIENVMKEFEKASLPEEKMTVLYLRASSGYIRAKNSEGSVLGEMLKEFGCVNIADSDSSLLENLSVESIIKADPYRIFIVQSGDDEKAMRENVTKMMEENPAWKELSAVKENRLCYLDKRLFNLKPNARWGEAYEVLSRELQK